MAVNEMLRSVGRMPDASTGVQRSSAGRLNEHLRETAEEFESVFLSQALQSLTHGLGGIGPFGTPDGDAFADMLQQEYGRLISRSGGIGIADAVMREMLKMQEMG